MDFRRIWKKRIRLLSFDWLPFSHLPLCHSYHLQDNVYSMMRMLRDAVQIGFTNLSLTVPRPFLKHVAYFQHVHTTYSFTVYRLFTPIFGNTSGRDVDAFYSRYIYKKLLCYEGSLLRVKTGEAAENGGKTSGGEKTGSPAFSFFGNGNNSDTNKTNASTSGDLFGSFTTTNSAYPSFLKIFSQVLAFV